MIYGYLSGGGRSGCLRSSYTRFGVGQFLEGRGVGRNIRRAILLGAARMTSVHSYTSLRQIEIKILRLMSEEVGAVDSLSYFPAQK